LNARRCNSVGTVWASKEYREFGWQGPRALLLRPMELGQELVKAARIIETEDDIRVGVQALRRKCAHLRRAHDTAGDPPLRRRSPGFEGLARIIVGQQLSVASANAIWARFEKFVTPMQSGRLIQRSNEGLRGVGLSWSKINTLRAIATAETEDGLDFGALEHVADDEVHARLTKVSGIGPWTADIYLMFCLGRADAFAPGDLALQVAAQLAMNLEQRPGANELAAIAERWRPWRSVAARLLWSYYRVTKATKSGVPV
jgi:DNA-3-methyladenine glycosylase II